MTFPTSTSKFTAFQRKIIYWLTYFSVCRYHIATVTPTHRLSTSDDSPTYKIVKSGPFRLAIYYGMWINTVIKITYLILTYRGYLMPIHFLDQMSIWDWFLCFSQLVQETNMWVRKYPLFEVLYSNWVVQDRVFKRLGCPKNLDERILNNHWGLVIMHTLIVFIGCASLMIQFSYAPKYALNTYAVFDFENLPMTFLFAAHEYLYMFHIWSHQATSIVLCEVFAHSYTGIVSEMRVVLEKLTEEQKRKEKTKKIEVKGNIQGRGNNYLENEEVGASEDLLGSTKVVPGTEYDIHGLLFDYKCVMMSTREFNNWVGKLQGGTTGSNYGQFVSDVFMMIQLLKEPETDVMAVFFFMEDAMAGMIMLFRMLVIISKLYPESEGFLRQLRKYAIGVGGRKGGVNRRKYFSVYSRTLRIVAAKLGGYSTRSITVPKGINALMNYYIGAAMWQRPKDRRT